MSGEAPLKIDEIPASLLCIPNITKYEESQRSDKKVKSESETEEKYILSFGSQLDHTCMKSSDMVCTHILL